MLKAYLISLIPLLVIAFGSWLFSFWKRDVSIVDSVWSVFFLATAISFTLWLLKSGPRGPWVLTLVGLWAIRLCAHIIWRNWGQPEDRRYQAIRQNNEPNFAFKSLYIVFFVQAILAWIISLPLLAALANPVPFYLSDYLGVVVFLFGLTFESLADWQLTSFKVYLDEKPVGFHKPYIVPRLALVLGVTMFLSGCNNDPKPPIKASND